MDFKDVTRLQNRLFIHDLNVFNYTGEDKEWYDNRVKKECIITKDNNTYFELRNYMNVIANKLSQCGTGIHTVVEVVLTVRGISTIVSRVDECMIYDDMIAFRAVNSDGMITIDIPDGAIVNIHFEATSYHGWITEIFIQETDKTIFPRHFETKSAYGNDIFIQYNETLAPIKVESENISIDDIKYIDENRWWGLMSKEGLTDDVFVANVDEFYKIRAVENNTLVNDILYKREDGQRPSDPVTRDSFDKLLVRKQIMTDLPDIMYITETNMVSVIDHSLTTLYELDVIETEMIKRCFSNESLPNENLETVELFKGSISIVVATLMKNLFDKYEDVKDKLSDRLITVIFAVKSEMEVVYHLMYKYKDAVLHGTSYITINE